MFVEEWTGFIDIQLSLPPDLGFTIFGKEYSITFHLVPSTLNAYISIGGKGLGVFKKKRWLNITPHGLLLC